MSRDYGELEREFIEGLAEDTGRSLAQWMALIDAQTFAHRNDMIDWLRQQKLTFAKASRLERIHHNGGKPLYGDRPAPKAMGEPLPPPVRAPAAQVSEPVAPLPPAVKPFSPPTAPIAAAAVQPPTAPAGDLNSFLAKAKGYRPLAELLIRTIRTAVPATTLTVHETHIELSAPAVYGALAVTAKDVRLALALGDRPFEPELKRLHLPGTGSALTHTVIINDARRVDATLMALVLQAIKTVNS